MRKLVLINVLFVVYFGIYISYYTCITYEKSSEEKGVFGLDFCML